MKHVPQRMCIACRTMCPQNELIRVVKDKETGRISMDTGKKLMGRGAYMCKNSACVSLAEKKHALERHFKCAVPKEIYEEAKRLL